MTEFTMNGYLWHVVRVNPNSSFLIDRSGSRRVATTDPSTLSVYLSDELQGSFLVTVLLHELGHCVMVSYDLIDDIQRAVRPEYWTEAEEWICNIIADHGRQIFSIAYQTLGQQAWEYIPHELERLVL